MHTIEYDGATVTYTIEGDVDGNKATIVNIIGGNFEFPIDEETIKDIKFHCESDYSDLVFKHYIKTGETL